MTFRQELRPGAFFNARAARYDAAYDAIGPDGYALRSRLAAVLRLLGDEPRDVLDAGMGAGRLCAELAARGCRVSGVDGAAEMVKLARERLPGATLLEADIERLPFEDESFDAAVATGVLEYVDAGIALRELARVLRPGGLAVVSYPNPHALYGLWKTRVFYPVVRLVKRMAGRAAEAAAAGSGSIPPIEFRHLLASAGLAPEQTQFTSFLVLPSPVDLLMPRLAERLGLWLEDRMAGLGPRLAAQVVYSARRIDAPS